MRKLFTHFIVLSILSFVSICNLLAQVAVPFTMTEAIFNGSDVDKGSKYIHVWEDGQIRMYAKGTLPAGCGICSNDHYFTVHISGVPDHISFTTSASGAATATKGWTLEESVDGSSWTRIWNKNARDCEVDMELSKTTKYVRLHENFNYSGYVKYFQVTACHYVKFVAKGKVIYTSEPLRKGEEISFSAPTAPTDECYQFLGWDKALPATMPNEDVVITAQYFVPEYKATIQLSDAAQGIALTDAENTYTCGDAVTVDVPAVKGFTFKGWNPELPSIASEEMDGQTYVAQWTRNIHTASYVVESDTQSFKVAYDATIPTVEEPEKNGYAFIGWKPAVPAVMPDDDVVMVAQFEKNVYLLSVLVDGDTVSSDSVLVGASIDRETLRPADKIGFDFSWKSEEVTVMPAKDVVILGVFERKNFALKIYDEDSVYVDKKVAFEEVINEETPVKRGYALQNWADLPSSMPAEDVNVALLWEKLYYPLVLMMGSDTFLVADYAYGDTIVYPAMPDSVNYAWVWDAELPVVMADADMVINGSWKIQQVIFSAISENDTIATTVYKPGDMIDPVVPAGREGYTFDGWDPEVPVVMPEQDFTTYAQWAKNSYPFYFMVDGDTTFAKEFGFQDSVAVPSVDERRGYTLILDQEVPALMPADTVTINAIWSINQYPFTLLLDDATAVMDTMIYYGTELLYEDLSKEGYTFMGWDPAIPATMPDSAFTAVAQWSVNKYPFYLMVDADTLYQAEFAYDEAVVLPTIEGEKGYTLVLNESLPATMPADTVIVTASWVQGVFPFVLMDGAETLVDTVITMGEALNVADLSKEGYTFVGWNPAIPAVMPDSSFSAYAQWSKNLYPFVMMVDGDTLFYSEYEFEANVAPAYDQKEGYTLVLDQKIPATMPADGVRITGNWEVNQHRFVLMDGAATVVDSVIAYGTELAFPDLTREGFVFEGWSPAIPAVMPDSDCVAHAIWSGASYLLTVIVDADTIANNAYAFGDSIVVPSVPEKLGYTFSWTESIPTVMPAENVVISGSYKANSYSFVVAVDGDTVTNERYQYGEKIPTMKDPAKSGFSFEGWSEAWPETMPAKDLTLNAKWSAAKFSFKAMDGAVTLVDTVYEFNAAIPALKKPTKEGHSFVGWDTVYSQMPAHEVVVNAQWKVLNYAITLMLVDADNGAMLGKPSRLTFAYGSEVVVDEPVCEGFEFSDWKNEFPATMPAKNFALIAQMNRIHQTTDCQAVANANVYVSVIEKTIRVVNYDGKQKLRVYDLLGNLIYVGNDATVEVTKSGIYLLKLGDITFKALVK